MNIKLCRVLLPCFFLFAGLLVLAGFFYGNSKILPVVGGNVKTKMAGNSAKDSVQGIARIDEEETERVVYSLSLSRLPQSDDDKLYLFTTECFEEGEALTGKPAAVWEKEKKSQVFLPYREEYLFRQFVPAVLTEGEYVPLGNGVYLSNPEALAENQDAYPEVESKKGILLDPTMLGTQELTDLDVKHTIYNIPLSLIMGETTDEAYPTISYDYGGEEYYFNGKTISDYDGLFTYLTSLGVCSTAVVLNDWNDAYPEMVHPKARDRRNSAHYYMFNTAEETGVRELEAVACFLAERYSGGEHGMVHNWVIANEINQYKTWNYMDTRDLTYYVQEFEKSFRIFYQAVKSRYASARVYFSIDHDWNSNEGDNRVYFNARDLVEAFNTRAASCGNYDWGIAIHPYPEPLTRVNYWSAKVNQTKEARILTIMNLNVLTDLLKRKEYLDTQGEVRSITITELGFSSRAGQKLQAAAFAYCYYIVEANPYIDAFILNRQTDAPEEMVSGLDLGLYEYDHSGKFMKEVFRYIDTDRAGEYTEFMLNILGAGSLEEALAWAK